MANKRDLLTAEIVLGAILPVAKVLIEDDPKMKKRFAGVNAIVQFRAYNGPEKTGAYFNFTDGKLTVVRDLCAFPDLEFRFSSIAKLNAFFAGKTVIPRIRGMWRLGLLTKIFSLLLGLKILLPQVRPKRADKRKLKVKMAFYMVTTALSKYNKAGDPDMADWTNKQKWERVYQITVDPEDIAAYLKVKAGKSKAGRGVYGKRSPFVHLKFNGVEGAFPVVMNDVDLVTAMAKGYLELEGSPEYARDLGDFMMRIQTLVT